jgi:hypothetical protein
MDWLNMILQSVIAGGAVLTAICWVLILTWGRR